MAGLMPKSLGLRSHHQVRLFVDINIFHNFYCNAHTILGGPFSAQQRQDEGWGNTQTSEPRPFSSIGMFACGHEHFP